MSSITYLSKPTEKLTPEELEQCSILFSNNYGIYSMDAPGGKGGKQIRMSSKYYADKYIKKHYRVALAKDGNDIIGQAFYIRERLDEGIYTWVLQLVVNKNYRRQGIASKLLYSIWGFSHDCAWGLATTNPYTVRTLERATIRHADPKEIMKHQRLVKKICDKVPYVQELIINETTSKANTNFYVDAKKLNENRILTDETDWLLGELDSGEEWIAFTFKDQPFDSDFIDELKRIVSFSEEVLKEAYGRMDMGKHSWAKHAPKEILFIGEYIGGFSGKKVLDAGCGHGRHSIEIGRTCSQADVLGVDFSSSNIDNARKKSIYKNVRFEILDLKQPLKGSFDVILCLYDVVGSYPDDEDNRLVLKNLYECCNPGGYLVLSVMNLELTIANALDGNILNVEENPEKLYVLPASDIMQSTGNIFKPEYYLVDDVHRLVYRKEQFSEEGPLPGEYVIRDRRFTMDEIKDMVTSIGFKVELSRYVQAGKWPMELDAIDEKAKEILIIARKV